MNNHLLYHALYQWYESNKRILPWRETSNPYYIWISEIILQQTRVAQGLEYYLRFIQRFPSIESLAQSLEDDVLLYWQGLGYYSRARNIYKAAQMIVQSSDYIARHCFPDSFEQLRQLPGVGDYTAGAIASFAYNMPYPALDGNVYRVLSRLYDDETVMDSSAGKKHFHLLASQLLDRHHPRLFNSAIMEMGAILCTPTSPNCSVCPLAPYCQALAHHTVELLPLRKKRPLLKDRYLNYTIFLTPSGDTLIHQRKEKDIWQHLWEFPLIESCQLNEVPLERKQIDLTHILSHQRLHVRFSVHLINELPSIQGTIPIRIENLYNYAFSKLTLTAIDRLLNLPK